MKSQKRLILIAVPLMFTGCLADPSEEPTGQISRPGVVLPPPSTAPWAAPPAKRPDDTFFTHTGSNKVRLPKYMTSWERTIQRLSQQGKAAGSPHADQYDNYRTNNWVKFFITKGPTIAGIRTPAEYEPSQAYLLSWNPDNFYQGATWKKLFTEIIKGAWGIVPVLLIRPQNGPDPGAESARLHRRRYRQERYFLEAQDRRHLGSGLRPPLHRGRRQLGPAEALLCGLPLLPHPGPRR